MNTPLTDLIESIEQTQLSMLKKCKADALTAREDALYTGLERARHKAIDALPAEKQTFVNLLTDLGLNGEPSFNLRFTQWKNREYATTRDEFVNAVVSNLRKGYTVRIHFELNTKSIKLSGMDILVDGKDVGNGLISSLQNWYIDGYNQYTAY